MRWNPIELLRQRKLAAHRAFDGPGQEPLLHDLAKFCRAFDTCFHTDPRLHAVLEGRREVWLRILRYLQLTPSQLAALHQAVVREQQGESAS